jgi:hypothetical protein
MLVTAYKDSSQRTRLLIGKANARRYFRKRSSSIELQLDDLHIQCTLDPDFWEGRPEIHDPRLSGWLEFKVARRGSGRELMQLALLPSGADKFVLRPQAAYQAFGAEIALPVKRESCLSADGRAELQARSVA